MLDLKNCPFCGGEATIGDVRAFLTDGKRVKCTKCHAGSMGVLIDAPKLNYSGGMIDESTRYTAEQAAQKAAELWNMRAEDGK